MTRLVQVALAEDVTEAEEIQAILQAAGITSELETAVEHHPRVDGGRTAEGAGRGVGRSRRRSSRSRR